MNPRGKLAGRRIAGTLVSAYDATVRFINTTNALNTLLIVIGVTGGIAGLFAIIREIARTYLSYSLDVSEYFFYAELVVLASVVILHKVLKYTVERRVFQSQEHHKIVNILSNMAYKNSRSDGRLFDTFQAERDADSSHQLDLDTLYKRTKEIAEDNIKDNLNCGASLFSVFTEASCSACIKLVRQVGEDIKLEVVFRDIEALSIKNRLSNYMYKLTDNTSFEEISRGKIGYYACDDLKKSETAEKYRNARPDWHKDYNATLVLPLRSMRRAPEPSRIVGFLCLDNHDGGFENETAFLLAKAICSRLEVIFHRLAVFEEELSGKNA